MKKILTLFIKGLIFYVILNISAFPHNLLKIQRFRSHD